MAWESLGPRRVFWATVWRYSNTYQNKEVTDIKQNILPLSIENLDIRGKAEEGYTILYD
jgi:hypothetical protein